MSDFDREWKRQERRGLIQSTVFAVLFVAMLVAWFIAGVDW